jgi:hypothetical protein
VHHNSRNEKASGLRDWGFFVGVHWKTKVD